MSEYRRLTVEMDESPSEIAGAFIAGCSVTLATLVIAVFGNAGVFTLFLAFLSGLCGGLTILLGVLFIGLKNADRSPSSP